MQKASFLICLLSFPSLWRATAFVIAPKGYDRPSLHIKGDDSDLTDAPKKSTSFKSDKYFSSKIVAIGTNVTNPIVEITKATQAAIGKSNGTNLLISAELEENVTETEIGGAAITAASLSLLQGGSLAVSSAAGVGAALVALTKGLPGDATRQVGDMAWTIGQRVVRLSEDPELTNQLVTISSAVLTRVVELLERNEETADSPQNNVSADQEIRNLREFTLAIYAFYDEFNRELERLEMEARSSDYKAELRTLDTEVQQMMQEMQLP